MKQTILCTSTRAALRPLLPCDVTPGYVDGLNDPVVRQFLAMRDRPWDRDSVTEYVIANWNSPRSVLFGIYLDYLIGTIRLHDLDLETSSGIIGICIFDKAHWGKGHGSSAVCRVVDFAVNELHLEHIWAGIEPGNQRSIGAFKHSGFEQFEIKPNGSLQFKWHRGTGLFDTHATP